MEKIFNRKNTIIFVGALTLWRIYLCATMALHPDEAYYWLWSRHLDIGYFDHPPMVAYFIYLTTLIGKSEIWVRFSGIIVSVIVSIITWILARQMFERKDVAAFSVMLLNAFPLMTAGALLVTPDVPAFLFWVLSIYFCWQIFHTGKTKYWYGTSLFLGLGLLSKYTVVLMFPCVLLFLLFSRERRWLITPHPYLAVLLSFIIFSPVLLWNSRHEWISFGFQLGHGLGGQSYSLSRMTEFLGSQLMVVSPFVWFMGMAAALVYIFKPAKERLFLVMTFLPVLLFFTMASYKKHAEANWPALSYFSFTLIFSGYFIMEGRKRRIAAMAAAFICLLISITATLHARFGIIPLERFSKKTAMIDATNWFYGYRELGNTLKKYEGAGFIITPSHQLSAQIAYYTDEKIPVQTDRSLARPSQFTIWKDVPMEGINGLYVTESDPEGEITEKLRNSGEGSILEVKRKDLAIRIYQIRQIKDNIIKS